MATYMLIWNPSLSEASTARIRERMAECARVGSIEETWSCGVTKTIGSGDHVLLVRLGSKLRGIIGVGEVLGSPERRPHWDADAAGAGKWSLMVPVRFTSMVEHPLVNTLELALPPFSEVCWTPQGSGSQIEPQVAEAIRSLYAARLGLLQSAQGDVDATLAPRWHQYQAVMAAKEPVGAALQQARDERPAAAAQACALIHAFCAGDIGLDELKDAYLEKTAEAWRVFNQNGRSGAMVLEKLCKNLGHDPACVDILRRVLRAPDSLAQAEQAMMALVAYGNEAVTRGQAKASDVPTKRIPAFLSGCWHLQSPASWPMLLQSSVDLLRADGLLPLKGGVEHVQNYLDFCTQALRVQRLAGLGPWTLPDMAEALMHREAVVKPNELGEKMLQVHSRPASPKEPDVGTLAAALSALEARDDAAMWLVAPGPDGHLMEQCVADAMVSIAWEELGDLAEYDSLEALLEALKRTQGEETTPSNQALACFEFSQVMQQGDVVFAKKGSREVISVGVVTSGYIYSPDETRRPGYPNIRHVTWGDFSPVSSWRGRGLPRKTLTNISQDSSLVQALLRHFGILADHTGNALEASDLAAPYGLDDAKEVLFVKEQFLDDAYELLEARKNIILQGPPGVGKSFLAKQLAYALVGKKPTPNVPLPQLCFVQFHQSYSYEHFVKGYSPSNGSYVLADGLFLKFCSAARNDPQTPYVLIIDEINRGNLSKIFGELLMLIEVDKRGEEWGLNLAYAEAGTDSTQERFYVPPNMHIIGTMNTADRALIVADYALRRRFAFLTIEPGFTHPNFVRELAGRGVGNQLIEHIQNTFVALNEFITKDSDLQEGFCVGHSYFCTNEFKRRDDSADVLWYERILRTEIFPLLHEYWQARKKIREMQIDLLHFREP